VVVPLEAVVVLEEAALEEAAAEGVEVPELQLVCYSHNNCFIGDVPVTLGTELVPKGMSLPPGDKHVAKGTSPQKKVRPQEMS